MKTTGKTTGFTLIELMMVVGIVALLVALAIPGYGYFVRKARRADVQADLVALAGIAERIYTQTNSYATVDDKVGGGNYIYLNANDFYTFSFPVAATASVYRVQAAPTSGTDQDKDACETMTLDQTGKKTKTGSETDCW